MWLELCGLKGVSGVPNRRIPPDDLSLFQASAHYCTRDRNGIVFPFSFFRPVSVSIRQSRLSDLGAALGVSPAVTRHWNARYYRHNRPVKPTWRSLVFNDPRTAYTYMIFKTPAPVA